MKKNILEISYDTELCGPFPLERLEYNNIKCLVDENESNGNLVKYYLILPEHSDPLFISYRIGELFGVNMAIMELIDNDEEKERLRSLSNKPHRF